MTNSKENLEIALTADSVKKALETYNKCNDIMEKAVKDTDELSQKVDEMDPDLFNIDDEVLAFPFLFAHLIGYRLFKRRAL